jgi:hypothetical protein
MTIASTLSDDQFKNLLAFLVLMANDRILDKSPDYIAEKFGRYVVPRTDPGYDVRHEEAWPWGLDSANTTVFNKYLTRWGEKVYTL